MEKNRELTETEKTYRDLIIHGLNSGKLIARDVFVDGDIEYHVVKNSGTPWGKLFARAVVKVLGDHVSYKGYHAFYSSEVYDACLDSMKTDWKVRSEEVLKKRLKALKRSL